MSYFKLPQFFILLILSTSCELFEEPEKENEIEEELNLTTTVTFHTLTALGTYDNNTYEYFNKAYWNSSGIYFSESTNPRSAKWARILNLNINEGSFGILYTPYAEVYPEASPKVHSTRVYPEFWAGGFNNASLIEGGVGYTPNDYIHSGGAVIQGGYINITKKTDNYISGNYYFAAWVYDTQYNRELMWGLTGTFENVPKQE